jgi:hypothetical protein
MASQYYYLVAGLPDLLLDEMKSPPAYGEAVGEMETWVSAEDAELLRTMRYGYDNANLIAILEGKDRPFDSRGNFTREELVQEAKAPQSLPDYMHALVHAHREGRGVLPGLSLEDQLNWLFYDEVTEHTNEFVREWFSFERDLRNLLAVSALRAAPGHLVGASAVSAASVVIGRTEIADRMAKSAAADLGVGQLLPWAERVLGLARANTIEFEKQIDKLRWGMLDDLTILSGFGIETLCAFAVKLGIVSRWQALDAAFGRDRLDALAGQLQAGYRTQ